MTATRGTELLGLDAGMVVQELGWGEDTDPGLRNKIMDAIDADMIEDAIKAVDMVVLWWWEDDGDVIDGLVDAMEDPIPTGFIWLLTPKVDRPRYVSPSDLAGGTATTGLFLTGSANVSPEW